MDRQPHFARSIAQALRQTCRIEAGSTLLVAVSGGADSVALLRVLHALAPRRRWHLELVVCHVQHHLRPAEGEQDAQFVAELCRQLDVPLIRHDLTPPSRGKNIEAWARQARYASLEQTAIACHAQAVLTAHHGDDLLETMLMRLIRGSSPRGLAGMTWRRRLSPTTRIPLCRPMLGVTHEQALAYLQTLNQPWQMDHTNQDTTRLRAAIRHQVLPTLKAMAPHVTQQSLAASEQLHAMAQSMQPLARQASQAIVLPTPTGWSIHRRDARVWPEAILRNLLHQHLLEAGVPADRINSRQLAQITSALRDKHGHQRVYEYAAGVSVRLDKTTLTIHKPQ